MGTVNQTHNTSKGAPAVCSCCGAMPEILLAEHVAAIIGVKTPRAARRRMNAGEFGRIVPLGRRIGILRSEFMRNLEESQIDPAVRSPAPWTKHLRRGVTPSGAA